ncbi:hypothetical protein BGX29_011816 [Mortierella sp. GBA35]|nr:hypothetical protein BGX29_011816 [Mortierella sp. GBA35]
MASIPTTPHQQRVLRMPELLESVAPHLSGTDLLACIRVCTLWNDCFIPHLWRTIDDSLYAWRRILYYMDGRFQQNEQWLQNIFAKYGHHIRHLIIRFRILIDVAYRSNACNNLLSIKILDIKQYHTYDERTLFSRIKYLSYRHRYDTYRPPHQRHVTAATGPLLSRELEGVFSPTEVLLKSKERQERDWMTHQYFWLLLRRNQGLRSISLHESLNLLSNMVSLPFFYETLAMLPNLASLENHLFRLDYSFLLDWVSSLRYYSTSFDSHMPDKHKNETRHFWNLRGLGVSSWMCPNLLGLILQSFPNLEALSLAYSDRGSRRNAIVLPTMPGDSLLPFQVIPKLKTLTTDAVLVSSLADELATTFLPMFPGLTRLRFILLPPVVSQALSRFCPLLEEVCQISDGDSIHRDYYSPSNQSARLQPKMNSLGALFQSCRNLRVFDAIQHKFDAEHLSSAVWICEGLQVFRCQIVGLERLNQVEHSILSYITESALEETQCSVEEQLVLSKVRTCQYLHEAVYDQLSRFTKLRVLDLGYEYRHLTEYTTRYTAGGSEYRDYGGLIENTLQLSLASGLDRLSTLKYLEVFGFEGVDHEIDMSEIQWMAEAWPRLRVLRGLQEERHLAKLKPNRTRKQLRKLMQALRPSVLHQSGRRLLRMHTD